MPQLTDSALTPKLKMLEPAPERMRVGNVDCVLRPLHASDEALLQAFFYSHTPETIRQRYGYNVTAMTYERAHDLVCANEKNDLALGIVETVEGQERLLAVSRYCLDTSGKSAEVAFVVHESYRRHGIASLLLMRMMSVARARGLERLWAIVSRSNQSMLRLFYKYGAKKESCSEDEEVCVVIDFAELDAGAH